MKRILKRFIKIVDLRSQIGIKVTERKIESRIEDLQTQEVAKADVASRIRVTGSYVGILPVKFLEKEIPSARRAFVVWSHGGKP